MLALALLAGLPGSVVALILLWIGEYAAKVQWTLTILVGGAWIGCAVALRQRVVRSLQTLSNMLAALHEGDYSMRAHSRRTDDSLGLAMLEANTLGETLRQQRLGALEASALLRKVMEEIDVAVLAFDDSGKLRLVNRGGERILARSALSMKGLSAEELGISDCLEGETPRIVERGFPGGSGRWELRTSTFRQDGRPHHLLVLSDLSRVLREEERQAWKRLIRVLSHEINNSLAPIRSIADSLTRIVRNASAQSETGEDLQQGLSIIASRADALSRFMASYARLARLPAPVLKPLQVETWIRRIAGLETRLSVQVLPGRDVDIMADGDQLDQLLINLVDNAVDAALETGGAVRVGWRTSNGHLEVLVEDEGPGVPDTSNLFVPFYTTKEKGSGIGLALCLQIAEAHRGSITVENRKDRSGCRARLRIPIKRAPEREQREKRGTEDPEA
ncbi:MAG: PAS domain-containing sensor histidine kinase [Gemmatimonadota bacterium]|nr:MAG: PAS domain-containing sensor histidine kinase [Gemmatimonadota bacterium]